MEMEQELPAFYPRDLVSSPFTARSEYFPSVLWIQTRLIRIRVMLFTLIRIWNLLFNLILIWNLLFNLILIRIRLFDTAPDPEIGRFKEVMYLKQYFL
jgi:hypothetical protein